jgi:hypothetical protein
VSFVADFISIQNEIAGGFRFGQIGCIVSYSFMVAPCCISISSLGVVGWERYQSVCNGNQWSHRKVHLWITGIWICSTFLTCLPFITSNYTTIHLDNTSVHCSVRWFDRTFVSIFMAVLILVMATISFSVATFSYYNVYNTYRILTKNKKANQDNQRIVFYKCVAMTICLVFMWTPYYVKVVYEITTGVAVSPDWSAIGSIFALFCPALNPFIIFYFDNRVRGNMLEVVHYIKGITIKKPSQSPASLLEKGAVNNPSFSVEKGDPLVSNTKHM